MPEIRTVTTLSIKRDELERAIANYEHALRQARIDLSHIVATITILDRTHPTEEPRYKDVHGLFARGEIVGTCKRALAEEGPLDTRELARRVMASKGFDPEDAILAKTVAYKVVQALRMQHLRGSIGDAGKRKGVRVWKLTR